MLGNNSQSALNNKLEDDLRKSQADSIALEQTALNLWRDCIQAKSQVILLQQRVSQLEQQVFVLDKQSKIGKDQLEVLKKELESLSTSNMESEKVVTLDPSKL